MLKRKWITAYLTSWLSPFQVRNEQVTHWRRSKFIKGSESQYPFCSENHLFTFLLSKKQNMCYGIEVIAWDLLVVVAIIMLIVWILGLVHVYTIPTGGLFHIFIVLAVIFLIAWIFVRCCGCGGRYRRRRGAAGGPIV